MVMEIVCNYKKCRKPLPNMAWVTTCSHAFCAEHGENEFVKKSTDILHCPACNSKLSDKFDVVQTDLNPSETFKCIILAGMKPDTIMDIAMRAISFWSYQMEEETRYQEALGKHAREKIQGFEELHSLNLQRIQVEIQGSKKKMETLQTDCSKYKSQLEEYSAILEDRNRKIQRLQFQLQRQKRDSIRINEEEHIEPRARQNISHFIGNRQTSTPKFRFQPTMVQQNNHAAQNATPLSSGGSPFVFNPVLKTHQQSYRQY